MAKEDKKKIKEVFLEIRLRNQTAKSITFHAYHCLSMFGKSWCPQFLDSFANPHGPQEIPEYSFAQAQTFTVQVLLTATLLLQSHTATGDLEAGGKREMVRLDWPK